MLQEFSSQHLNWMRKLALTMQMPILVKALLLYRCLLCSAPLMLFIRQILIHNTVCHDKCVSSWNINFAINFHTNCIYFYQSFTCILQPLKPVFIHSFVSFIQKSDTRSPGEERWRRRRRSNTKWYDNLDAHKHTFSHKFTNPDYFIFRSTLKYDAIECNRTVSLVLCLCHHTRWQNSIFFPLLYRYIFLFKLTSRAVLSISGSIERIFDGIRSQVTMIYTQRWKSCVNKGYSVSISII